MKAKIKKRLSFFTIGTFFLLGGIEYAVILPTLWLYLSSYFNGQPYLLGTILSAFFCSGLLSGPVMGWWSDRTQNTKAVLFVSTLFEAAGSFMYFMGISAWFLVLSRFIAGLGTGVGSAIVADVSRITTGSIRTSAISTLFAIRNVGILIGPACNLFLREMNFKIGPFVVNEYTSPGLFMAALWVIMALIVLLMYSNLPQLHQQLIQEEEQQIVASRPDSSNSTRQQQEEPNERQSLLPANRPAASRNMYTDDTSGLLNSLSYEFNGTRVAMFPADSANGSLGASGQSPILQIRNTSDIRTEDSVIPQGSSDGIKNTKPVNSHAPTTGDAPTDAISVWSWKFIYNEYVREEVVVIFAVSFVTTFNQISMETMVTPLTQKLLFWGDLENSILFFLAAVELLIVFLVVTALTRCLHDRSILFIGYLITLLTVAYLTWFVPQAEPGNISKNLPNLIIGVAVDLMGMPFLASATASLLSKRTAERTQGFTQGFKGVFDGIANILAPLWVGGTLYMPYIMFGVMDAIMIIVLGMVIISFKYLKSDVIRETNRNDIVVSVGDTTEPNDRRALLNESA